MIPLKHPFPSFIFSITSLIAITFTEASQPLEFCSAFQDILRSTYEIKAADAEIYAKEADRWQAGAYPNPALSLNLSSIGRNQGDNENELFIGVTQLVELGGKRSARLRVASASQCTSQWNLEVAKNELFSKLLHAFIDMASAQERLELAHGQQNIAKQTLQIIITQTKSGRTSGLDEKKALLAFQSAKLIYLKQQLNLQKAKKQLVAIWDYHPPIFDCVNFPLYKITPPPSLECLCDALKNSPELIKAEAESALANEIVSLERSRRIPDLALQVGVTTEKFVQQPALSVGFGIPLPFFDRNEGNISRASYEQLQAFYNQMDVTNQLRSSLELLYHEWLAAYEQATMLKESILPSAEENFQLAQESYQEGKSDYLYLLNAHSTWFDVQQQYLEVIEEYHHKRAEILKLTSSFLLNEI